MKTFKFLLLITTFIFIATNCIDTTKDDNKPSAEKVVSIGCAGEIGDITVTPLTKGDVTNDLMAIQVFSKKLTDDGEVDRNSEYVPYAMGLFDDFSDIKIKLMEGYSYTFNATYAKDSKTKLYHSEEFYSEPFKYAGDKYGNLELSNDFNYSNTTFIESIFKGNAYITDSNRVTKFFSRPDIDRFVGKVEDFTLDDDDEEEEDDEDEEDEDDDDDDEEDDDDDDYDDYATKKSECEDDALTIDFYRASFGCKVNVSGLKTGKIAVEMENTPGIEISYPDTTYKTIFSFKRLKECFGTDYYEDILVSVNHISDSGDITPIGSKTVKFIRNKLTTIFIKISDKASENSFGFEFEDDELEDGEDTVIGDNDTDEEDVNHNIMTT